MSKTIAVHVRYKFSYISLPSCAKQERQNDQVPRRLSADDNDNLFSYFRFDLEAVMAYLD